MIVTNITKEKLTNMFESNFKNSLSDCDFKSVVNDFFNYEAFDENLSIKENYNNLINFFANKMAFNV